MTTRDDAPGLAVWIDARDPSAALRVFGMTLLERLLRSVEEAGIEPGEVRVELAPGAAPPDLPGDLRARLRVAFSDRPDDPARILAGLVGRAGRVLALEAGAIVDPRLLAHGTAQAGGLAVRGGSGQECTAIVWLDRDVPAAPPGRADLVALAESWLRAGALKELPLAEVPDYVRKLRRRLPAYCFRVPDPGARDRAERFLFRSNYKGSTDFLTRWVYPPLVWGLLRPLARRRVHPNWLSGANVGLAFAAVPLFAAGLWVPGLALAYAMSLLDSVDGKLARLTFRASRLGHALDHGLDVIHPPVWYLAWAWPLAGGSAGAPVFGAALGLTALYFLDRIVTELFTRASGGGSIHAWRPLDATVRTFVSRRNVNLPIFTLGLLGGRPVEAFVVIVAWQAATLGFHAVRLVQYLRSGREAEAGAAGATPSQ